MMKKITAAATSGALFAIGLVVSGMTQPSKVLGFLNVGGLFNSERFGVWDASLAFVMGGALCVTLLAYAITPKNDRSPWFADKFHLPTRKDVDGQLLLGSALFGIGWGLVGYCPGPALASVLTGGADVLYFVLAMLVGMIMAKRFVKYRVCALRRGWGRRRHHHQITSISTTSADTARHSLGADSFYDSDPPTHP